MNFPIKLWRAMDDATVDPATVATFAAAAPNCTVVDIATGGHDPGIAPADDVARWLAAA